MWKKLMLGKRLLPVQHVVIQIRRAELTANKVMDTDNHEVFMLIVRKFNSMSVQVKEKEMVEESYAKLLVQIVAESSGLTVEKVEYLMKHASDELPSPEEKSKFLDAVALGVERFIRDVLGVKNVFVKVKADLSDGKYNILTPGVRIGSYEVMFRDLALDARWGDVLDINGSATDLVVWAEEIAKEAEKINAKLKKNGSS